MATPIDIHFKTAEAGKNKVTTVVFAGELDETNIDDAAKEVYKIIDSSGEGAKMLFDFTKLNYLNSKSIGFLSDWYTKLTERSSTLVVAGAQENILDILQTVGLDNFVTLSPSLDEGYKALGVSGASSEQKSDTE